MTNKRTVFIVVALVTLVVIVAGANFYFMYYLNAEEGKLSSMRALENMIRSKMRHLKPVYLNRNPRFFMYRNKLLRNYKPVPYENASILWDIANWWPQENEVYPMYDSSMGQLLQSLRLEPITKAQNLPRGTQLKILLKLANQQKIIFKPQWYDRDVVIDGPVYGGKDRHTAEVYAFYLGAVLNFRWTPIAVGRKINLKEMYEKADSELRHTMTITEGENSTEYCVFGKCHYCNEDETVCGDENNIIEGVLLYLIPGSLAKKRSPWQRTYKDGVRAPWEDDMNYCKSLKNKLETTRLLDLIDVAIFDYLIQNGDRHHYETREDRIVLIDNGKAFGNPNKDFLDILAPLYQCCMLRKTTWDRLQVFSGGVLTDLIDRLSKPDPLHPLITDKHKRGVERRLLVVYAVVEYCMDIYDDKMFKT
ncbi:glycosaminoglycan xylosylkinase homolog [Eupeodes corollae]|uniref:glycosaminoglycan xylosylkinase homolog n=1 Tax=Eupeodes corollae TaxID=290404 RepID=UPI0024922D34|nr:glycosaminoglycan xylosylkinase homolog [Eupeodes corollae]XP_055903701.1 glycosaminoglycan xylosylkinase homolog [Eupeodes corollae]XP_055903702.1 glycosaminoglycan xylosylkinase homolog [Eupeodes corollae]